MRAGASPADQAAQSSTAQAELVGCLGGTGATGAAGDKTGPSLLPLAPGGPLGTRCAWKDAVAERVRFVAVCYSAEACDLVGFRAWAGPADRAAHRSIGQAELVCSLAGNGGAGTTRGKTGTSI